MWLFLHSRSRLHTYPVCIVVLCYMHVHNENTIALNDRWNLLIKVCGTKKTRVVIWLQRNKKLLACFFKDLLGSAFEQRRTMLECNDFSGSHGLHNISSEIKFCCPAFAEHPLQNKKKCHRDRDLQQIPTCNYVTCKLRLWRYLKETSSYECMMDIVFTQLTAGLTNPA